MLSAESHNLSQRGALWSDFSDSRKLDVHVQSINFAQGSVCNDRLPWLGIKKEKQSSTSKSSPSKSISSDGKTSTLKVFWLPVFLKKTQCCTVSSRKASFFNVGFDSVLVLKWLRSVFFLSWQKPLLRPFLAPNSSFFGLQGHRDHQRLFDSKWKNPEKIDLGEFFQKIVPSFSSSLKSYISSIFEQLLFSGLFLPPTESLHSFLLIKPSTASLVVNIDFQHPAGMNKNHSLCFFPFYTLSWLTFGSHRL